MALFTQSWSFPVDGPVSAVRMGTEAKVFVGSGSNAHIFDCRDTSYQVDLNGLASPISALAGSKSVHRLAAGTDGGSLRLWDVESQKVISTYSNCHRAAITSVEYHPFGEFVATASRDTVVRIWDPRKPSKALQSYKVPSSNTTCPPAPVELVRYSPDGRWAVSGDANGVMRIFDLMQGKLLHELPSNDAAITSLAFHPTRCNVAVASANGGLTIWDAESLQKVHTTAAAGMTMVDFSERGLVWSGSGGKVIKLSAADWNQKDVLESPWTRPLDDFKCDPDGTMYAVQKAVTGISVTMFGAPSSSKASKSSAPASKATATAAAAAVNLRSNNSNTPLQRAAPLTAPPSVAKAQAQLLPNQQQQQQQQPLGDNNVNVNNNSNANTPTGESSSSAVGPYDSFFSSPVDPRPQQQQGGAGATLQQRRSAKSEDQLVDEALNRSDNMSALVQRRLTHIRVFRSLWQQHPDRALVHLEQSMSQDASDCGAIIDFFQCLSQQQRVKEKIIMEHVPSVMRLVTMVLTTHHRIEPFVLSSLKAARYVNSKFRHRIEETLRAGSHAAPGVDLSMETRIEKARQCHRLMCEVRDQLSQFVARPDGVGEEARNLAKDLPN